MEIHGTQLVEDLSPNGEDGLNQDHSDGQDAEDPGDGQESSQPELRGPRGSKHKGYQCQVDRNAIDGEASPSATTSQVSLVRGSSLWKGLS